MKKYTVFDLEADGLNPTVIYCVSYKEVSVESESEVKTLTTYSEMRDFFLDSSRIFVGHNIIRFDIPVAERLLGIIISSTKIDTLALSWYLYPERTKHGLEEWGVHYGVPKPKIDSWVNLPLEDYINRCQEDVKINTKLFKDQFTYLWELYDNKDYMAERLCDYLTFKLDCAREQEEIKWKIDIEATKRNLKELVDERESRLDKLRGAMPENIKYVTYNMPKVMYKKDGTLSSHGERWIERIVSIGLPVTHTDPIKIPKSRETGNPDSNTQLKRWITSLGWIPETYKYIRDKNTGEVRKIPQISLPNGGGLCPSVKKLYNVEPKLENLDSLYVLRHRIGLLKGFLRDSENGWIKAEIAGLTNTLRFKHAKVVNLPGVRRLHGDKIRGVLTSEEGYILCGSDMSSLEDRTKQHYMYEYDPEYVKSMIKPGFDPHLDLAIFAGALTEEQAEDHKAKRASYSKIRYNYKTANYACVYGAGEATLSRSLGCSKEEARRIIKAYWDRNWSVNKVAEEVLFKEVNNQMWLRNPISGFWYSLRYKKDKFSTLNQGTGVYCFDLWVMNIRKRGLKICGQFHDEVIIPIKLGDEDKVRTILRESIKSVNDKLPLNRNLDIDVQFGQTYAEIH